MNLFLINSKVNHCKIKVASPGFSSKITIHSFPETLLVHKSLQNVTFVVFEKKSISQIIDVDLITGETRVQDHIQHDIAAAMDFVDTKLIDGFIRQLHSLFSRCNMLKRAVHHIAESSSHNGDTEMSVGVCQAQPQPIGEISTEFFILTHISSWPSVNRQLAKASDYIDIILKKSFINGLLAYMTPLTWSTYVKELNTHCIVKEFVPTVQKLVLRLIYSSGIYRSTLINRLERYLTKTTGTRLDTLYSSQAITRFVKMYNINMDECVDTKFNSFNDFFYRRLKPGARRIEIAGKMSSPADCRLLGSSGCNLEIKGKFFNIDQLLNDTVDYKSVCISRLAPQDYHRFHAPLQCEVVSIRNIQGLYRSVNPVNRYNKILDENVRTVIVLKTERGTIYYVAIGALLVGSIVLSVEVGSKLNQMDEIGYFRYGGSCIVMISDFEWGLRDEIDGNSLSGVETIVRVGDCIEKVGS